MKRAVVDDASFEEWAGVHGPRLKGTALLLCRDEHEADDLVQETLTRLYERWARVRRMSDAPAYARSTLSNLYLSRWRRWQTERSKRHLLHRPDAAADGTQAVTDRDSLDSWLALLGPKQRAAVVLRYYCDQSTAQIAEVLDCSEATVRTQIMRALTHLREHADAATRSETAEAREQEEGTRHADRT